MASLWGLLWQPRQRGVAGGNELLGLHLLFIQKLNGESYGNTGLPPRLHAFKPCLLLFHRLSVVK